MNPTLARTVQRSLLIQGEEHKNERILDCFRIRFYVGQPTTTHNGFHNSGAGAEGACPTVVDVAEGRLHYGWWWVGQHKSVCGNNPKHVCFCVPPLGLINPPGQYWLGGVYSTVPGGVY